MIRDLSDLTLSNGLSTLYAGLAAAVSAGGVLGVVGLLLTSAARGGQ